ncbi:beta-lactamase family protein [Arcanobacterium haemolyticum]|nr:beta-lactamase family protein [Arcanobacterium haemolyticum]
MPIPFSYSLAVVGGQSPKEIYSEGDTSAVFPLASVTKLLAAWSTLVALDRGLIDLRDPAGPEGSTIRHLLAHASGVPFDKGAILARPGDRRIYSNRGIELLGDAVASRVGMPIQEWILQSVLRPLGMDSTTIPGSPAYSGRSCVADLELFAAEVMAPRLVSTIAGAAARTVQFPGLSGILPGFGRQATNDWGLGFEIRDHKDPHWTGSDFSPRTYGHFGQAGSFLWIDPTVRRAGIFLGEKPFGNTHRRIWPDLTNRMRAL